MRTALLSGVLTSVLVLAHAHAQDASGWKRPPEPIASLVDAEPLPSVGLSPCRT